MSKPVPFGQRLQNVHSQTGDEKCSACGISRDHHFIVNHIFVFSKEPEIWCDVCQRMYTEQNYQKHKFKCLYG